MRVATNARHFLTLLEFPDRPNQKLCSVFVLFPERGRHAPHTAMHPPARNRLGESDPKRHITRARENLFYRADELILH
jgi:hypothetical protein